MPLKNIVLILTLCGVSFGAGAGTVWGAESDEEEPPIVVAVRSPLRIAARGTPRKRYGDGVVNRRPEQSMKYKYMIGH